MKKRITFISRTLTSMGILFCLVLMSFPINSQAAIQNKSGDLVSEFNAIKSNMPGSYSNGYTVPNSTELSKWRTLIGYMLAEDWNGAESYRASNFSYYTLYRFTDTGNGNAVYYMLQENTPVNRGWGTYVFATSGVWDRPVVIEAPHPMYDINTHAESPDVWRMVKARYLIMAGTHRNANSASSPCSGSYKISDMAHVVDAIFHVTHEEIVDFNPSYYQVQLHGFGSTCSEDIFSANGSSSQVTAKLLEFTDDLVARGINAKTLDNSSCNYNATTNTQGRYTNGSSNICTQNASSITEQFVHIEQKRAIRESYADYSLVAASIRAVFTGGTNDPPTAEANGPYSGTAGSAISFSSAGSTDSDGTITGYSWDFGDGNTSTQANPSHTYASDGNYTVTLTVTDNDGATGVDTASVTADPPANVPPTAEANGPYSEIEGSAISFSSAGSTDSDGTITGYSWDFGDGYTSTQTNPSYTYASAGSYTVTLTVTDNEGATGNDTASVNVTTLSNSPPIAEANGPYNGTEGAGISFSSAGSSDSDGTITAYDWDFGDGNTSTQSDPVHTYVSAGNYTVTLTVTDNDSGTGVDTASVTVNTAGGTPTTYQAEDGAVGGGSNTSTSSSGYNGTGYVTFPSSGGYCEMSNIDGGAGGNATMVLRYVNGSSDRTGDLIVNGVTQSYTMTPTGGWSTWGTQESTITLNSGTSNTIRFESTGQDFGNIDEITITPSGSGNNNPPTADANGPYTGTEGQEISFSSAGSCDSDGTITDYEWDFGDGNTSIQANPSHTYASASNYTATLTITDNDGATGVDTVSVTVNTAGGGSWTQITYDDFESGWGNWNDGGTDAVLYTSGTYAYQGSSALNIQDNTSTSVVTTNNLVVSGYAEIKVDFHFYPNSMESGEDFWLQISTDGGSSYTTVKSWARGNDFENNSFYSDSVVITGHSLNDQTRIRFRCDASGNQDDIYLDAITISAQ